MQHDYTQLEQLADLIKDSRFLPDYLRGASKADILFTMIRGSELGLNPLQSLASLYLKVDENLLTLNAAGMRALVLREGYKLELLKYTPEGCVLRGEREDARGILWSQEVTYTLEDARIEGVLGNPFWKKVPAAMCLARATGVLVRFMFADVVQGIYSIEEVTDGEPMMRETRKYFGAPVQPVPPTPTPKKPAALPSEETNNLLNYTIKSDAFLGKNKLSPLGEWSVGSLRFALNTLTIKATLSDEDVDAMTKVLHYRVNSAAQEEKDITLAE